MHAVRCMASSSHIGLRRQLSSSLDSGMPDRYKTIRSFFVRQLSTLNPVQKAIPGPARYTSNRIGTARLQARLPLRVSRTETRSLFVSHVRRKGVGASPNPNEGKDGYEPENPKKANEDSAKLSSETKHNEHNRHYNLEEYSYFFRRLAMSLPPMQRPTRDDFLKVATNFWQRLRIRFKWFTVRSFRPFNADDMSAFFTWFLMSQTVWIFVGTTTFFSVIFTTLNSLRLQEYVARAISDYLTSETGITIIFESAIVPKWKNSMIAFKNVYVSRRPPSLRDTTLYPDTNAAHRAAARYDVGNHPAYHGLEDDHGLPPPEPVEDVDYTVFDLNVDSIDVTLSLWRWFDGKGLIEDAVIKGVRGVLDRRYIQYDPDKPLNPADFRRESSPGDFELESLQIEDLLITVYQPGSFRPYTASIFRADIKTFRKRWMFYDFLSAENVVGQFDNCLFSLHMPQSIGRTTEQDLKDTQWSRMARFRIDGVNIDHIQRATTMEGPISWITSGKVDAVLDIKFPQSDEPDINAILSDIAEAITNAASSQASRLVDRIPGQRELAKPAISTPEDKEDRVVSPRVVVIDIDLRFRDLKAIVPMFTSDLSYVNNALIRPIVAFINTNKTLVPIHCRIIKDISEFDGAWTMWETGLMDEIALKVYEALAYHVTQANFNKRVRTVSYWSLQKTIAAALAALQSTMQPMSVFLHELRELEPFADMQMPSV